MPLKIESHDFNMESILTRAYVNSDSIRLGYHGLNNNHAEKQSFDLNKPHTKDILNLLVTCFVFWQKRSIKTPLIESFLCYWLSYEWDEKCISYSGTQKQNRREQKATRKKIYPAKKVEDSYQAEICRNAASTTMWISNESSSMLRQTIMQCKVGELNCSLLCIRCECTDRAYIEMCFAYNLFWLFSLSTRILKFWRRFCRSQ